jgi:hypothetical protein
METARLFAGVVVFIVGVILLFAEFGRVLDWRDSMESLDWIDAAKVASGIVLAAIGLNWIWGGGIL